MIILISAGLLVGYSGAAKDAEKDILAISVTGEKELGLEFIERKYGGPRRWARPMFWNRRIGIVRRYVEGVS